MYDPLRTYLVGTLKRLPLERGYARVIGQFITSSCPVTGILCVQSAYTTANFAEFTGNSCITNHHLQKQRWLLVNGRTS